VSDRFRDLEAPDEGNRKDIVLMAAVSGFESLAHPTRQDLRQFSRLFLPLYAVASPQARRTASAALSRLATVPDDIVERLIFEPIEIAAPFIAHHTALPESALARAIAHKGPGHARAAARRPNLSAAGLAALSALREPSVDRALMLRGLSADAVHTQTGVEVVAPVGDMVDRSWPAFVAERTGSTAANRPVVDGSEALREDLRRLASRGSSRAPGVGSLAGLAVAQSRTLDEDARAQVEMRPHRAGVGHLARLARHARSDEAQWFATALADAMAASFDLAERIMLDISGTQLATALIALGADHGLIRTALEAHFPHLAAPSRQATCADDLILSLDHETCAARLAAWQRADAYTRRMPVHVPQLAETRPVRGKGGARPLIVHPTAGNPPTWTGTTEQTPAPAMPPRLIVRARPA